MLGHGGRLSTWPVVVSSPQLSLPNPPTGDMQKKTNQLWILSYFNILNTTKWDPCEYAIWQSWIFLGFSTKEVWILEALVGLGHWKQIGPSFLDSKQYWGPWHTGAHRWGKCFMDFNLVLIKLWFFTWKIAPYGREVADEKQEVCRGDLNSKEGPKSLQATHSLPAACSCSAMQKALPALQKYDFSCTNPCFSSYIYS